MGRTGAEADKPIAVALFSGGLDSTTLLWWLARRARPRYAPRHFAVHALTLAHGQRNAGPEAAAARAVAAAAQAAGVLARHVEADLSALAPLLAGSALHDPAAPLPRGYETEASARRTFVPNRNAVLLSVAYAYAQSVGAAAVAIGTYDALYPDCCAPFLSAFARMERRALAGMTRDERPIRLLAPFVRLGYEKADVVALGAELGVPFHLTRSCLDGGERPCGLCATCVSRRDAFAANGLDDPAGTRGGATGRRGGARREEEHP